MRRGAGRGFVAASPTTALVFGGVVLTLMIAEIPLASLAQQSVNASGGSLPVWFSAPFAVLGFVIAWRKPRNPLGWIILGVAGSTALGENASFYVVASYHLRHGGLPLAWVALLAQPTWSVGIVLIGLAILLFPDGRLPSSRLRWWLWLYLAGCTLCMAGAFIFAVGAIVGHAVHVDSSGNLLTFDNPTGAAALWGTTQAVVLVLTVANWLVSLGGQVVSYRRSSGERRQQLKWLIGGFVICVIAIAVSSALPAHGFWRVVSHLSLLGIFALPVGMSVAILKYRLYEIDRILSRTVAYAIVTGLLVGVYAGLVLLATRVLPLSSGVAVAGSTLVAAALFSPLRQRVQHSVDRRFNRGRYDAELIVSAFAARLQDMTDLHATQADLATTIQRALEPAHVSVWTWQAGS
jgi:hypothetical protein